MADLLSSFTRSLLRRGERAHVLDSARVAFVAWPWLCDFQGHITNARYLDLMAVGRAAWLAHTGLLRSVLSQGYVYIVAGTGITYRREIRRMQAFTLETRVAAFDERWLYMEYSFLLATERGTRVAARAFTRGQIQQRKRACPPRDVLTALRPELAVTSPQPAADFQTWLDAQDATLRQIRTLEHG